MQITPIKTRIFTPPKDNLFSLIRESFKNLQLKEKSIFVITSKIVSIWQGRCVKIENVKDKDELVKKEADFYLDRDQVPESWVMLTLKNNLLIPTAGIDESNAKGYYILWPKKPFQAAKEIYNFIKKNYNLKEVGVIISDSHSTPGRWGIMGISISYYGFYPLKDYRGKSDIFGRELKITQSNIADSLTAGTVICMGEGKEKTPIAIISDINFDIDFSEFDSVKNNPLTVNKDDDLYYPLLNSVKWKKY